MSGWPEEYQDINRSLSESNISIMKKADWQYTSWNKNAGEPHEKLIAKITHKILIRELIQIPNQQLLVREYSSETECGLKVPQVFSTKFYSNMTDLLAKDKMPASDKFASPRLKEIQFEKPVPMEVNSEECAYETVSKHNVASTPRRLTINTKLAESTIKETSKCLSLYSLLAFVIIIISIMIYNNKNLIGTHIFLYNTSDNQEVTIINAKKLMNLKQDLQLQILGQNSAISTVITCLEKAFSNEHHDYKKLLPIVGTTGVGKTFLANILKKHFENLVFEVDKTHLHNINVKELMLANAKLDGICLVIIDNLKFIDLDSVMNFVQSLPDDNRMKIVFFAIFNTHVTDVDMRYSTIESNLIAQKLDIMNMNCDIALFEAVDVKDLHLWLFQELRRLGAPDHALDTIAENVLRNHDIQFGFKGLRAKMVLEFEIEQLYIDP